MTTQLECNLHPHTLQSHIHKTPKGGGGMLYNLGDTPQWSTIDCSLYLHEQRYRLPWWVFFRNGFRGPRLNKPYSSGFPRRSYRSHIPITTSRDKDVNTWQIRAPPITFFTHVVVISRVFPIVDRHCLSQIVRWRVSVIQKCKNSGPLFLLKSR